jgi:hypothetical protein
MAKSKKIDRQMDTNDLSRQTHNAIIDTAERFHHDLTLQFGVMAYNCNSDNEFIDKSEARIKDWLDNRDMDYLIQDIFFDRLANRNDFKKVLDEILNNIVADRQIPMEQRKFDLW